MKKTINKTIISFLLILSLVLIPASRSAAYSYSASTAIEYARSHCSSNHTEYKGECPNGWLCAEFVANCLKAGGLDIVPSQLKGVRALYNKLSGIGNCMEIEISSSQTSSGDRYIKNTGSNVGKISPGDAIITRCTKHDIYLHAILVSEINANGNIYAYAHNGNSFNRIVTASRSCKDINYSKEDYSDIKAYVIHFDGSGPAPTPQAPGYAAAINTDGSLAINDKPASSNAGLSTMLSAIPEGAVCKTYPDKASGNWMWVEFRGVSGYAYNKYLTPVSCVAENALEVAHPHRTYTQYSNGYIEYGNYCNDYEYYTENPTCITSGCDVKKCSHCDYVEKYNYTDPVDHRWNSGVITQYPTENSEGIMTYTCEVCNETKIEKIAPSLEPIITPEPQITPRPTNTPEPGTFAAAINTDGSLAVNDKPAISPGYSTMLIAIPEGAVCKTFPEITSGNWIWVEYQGVSGYAYSKYLTPVDCIVYKEPESTHPHRLYTKYSNGYISYGEYAEEYTTITKEPTCTEVGYDEKKCNNCDISEKSNFTEPTGHRWNSGVITLAPTITSEGIMTYTCEACNETKTMPIGKLTSTENTQAPSDSSSTSAPAATGKPQDSDMTDLFNPDDVVVKVGQTVTHTESGGKYKVLSGKRVKYMKSLDNRSSVIIPSYIKLNGINYKVVTIGSKAFYRNTNIKSVTVGKNVSCIEHNAFNGCTNLKEIYIKTTKLKLSSVGSKAFKHVKKASIKVPAKKQKLYQKILIARGYKR